MIDWSVDFIIHSKSHRVLHPKYLFFLFCLFFSGMAYSLPTHINPDNWVEKPPSEANVNFYDEILLDIVPRYFHNISPHGYNYGTKIEADVLIWEGKDICAFVFYDRVFDPGWAYGFAYVLGAKLESLWKQSNNAPKVPFYHEKCAMFDTSADYSGKKKEIFNKNFGRIDKKKGIKGNLNPVRTQTFEYKDPALECLFLGGGLGTSGWAMYDSQLTTASIGAHICVQDGSYFTRQKIKQLARSLGVKEIDGASLKIKAEAPEDLLLDLSKFTEVTGKRDDYSINLVTDNEDVIDDSNNLDDIDDFEKKLEKLKSLFENNLITKEEYDEQRLKILDQM